MLQVQNIEAGYGQLKILKNVSIKAKQGDLVAIIGPNGSGKSTAIKSIFGLLTPTKGKVMFKGQNIAGKRPDEIVQLGISYVPQGRMVFQTMSVEENLEMGAFTVKDHDIVKKRIKQIYRQFPELRKKKYQKATFLSGGQQQMLSIGRALMLEPEMILLDEPSLGLAPKLMQNIFKKIKQINKQGITIVLVEQNAHMALEICNKAYVIEQGKIALRGGPEIANRKIVKNLYLGH